MLVITPHLIVLLLYDQALSTFKFLFFWNLFSIIYFHAIFLLGGSGWFWVLEKSM